MVKYNLMLILDLMSVNDGSLPTEMWAGEAKRRREEIRVAETDTSTFNSALNVAQCDLSHNKGKISDNLK